MSEPSIALNRFGLGARPKEPLPQDGPRWVSAQFDRFDARPSAIAALPSRKAIFGQLADYLQENRAFIMAAQGGGNADRQPGAKASPAMRAQSDGIDGRANGDALAKDDPQQNLRKFIGGVSRGNYIGQVGARTAVAMGSQTPFVERMVHFWANHFAVSADKLTVIGVAGLLEFDAIRPHVLGKFGDMLGAVERHPSMLLYLDQAQSIGPNSQLGARVAARGGRKLGLNENLAREIMELHTLGVRTGYTQADVTEFARAMTGWSVAGLARGPIARFARADGPPGDFVFVEQIHEPGTRRIMGRSYDQSGERQAQAVLDELAGHSATATHIATKLARHFTGDNPPQSLIDRLQASFMATGGDLPALYATLIGSPEAWVTERPKFRTPWEWSIAAMRALSLNEIQPAIAAGLMNQLGQPVWKPGSPAGYDDVNASWAGPDAIMRRVEAAERLAAKAGSTVDARTIAERLFPGMLSPATRQILKNAESPQQAIALLLVSPEAMRR